MKENLLLYGAKLDSENLRVALEHIFKTNLESQKLDKRGTPVCIWGTHGLGKTTLVQEFAKKNNWQLAYCAPAQFEEMGDLHGIPYQVDPDKDVIGDEYTAFAPPDWVPTEEGPGILLLDDINRADDRILRGLMQLLQNFELFSWQLPAKWQIVATANPEGGDYSVTAMDDAMLTRLLHLTMVFDPKSWAKWAEAAGVDSRGIDFVLTYPEVVTGKRSTPRSLVQFFEQIAGIPDLKKEIEMVSILAMSSLDDVTVGTFLGFVNDNLEQLVSPEDILDAKDFKKVSKRIENLSKSEDGGKRVDRLATICTRLYLVLTKENYDPKSNHADNLVKFMLLTTLPNDLRMSFHSDLMKNGSDKVKAMLRDKRLAKLLLDGM
tara:strand:+ start:1309 stop:2439 length:1131 start_codon:yes stop_codon:yes gene_type:complete